MKTQLRNLLTRGYEITLKKEIINYFVENGKSRTVEKYNITPSTLNRLVEFKDEILKHDEKSVLCLLRTKKRIRSEEYKRNYRLKHHPGVKRKKHPFLVIANYASSNYKLVCYRSGIKFDESQKIKPIELYGLAKKQKCLCALSGIKLTAENISIDHIVQVSKGGSNKIENIRLTHSKINKMRNDMEDLEFFEFCERVASYMKGKS